MTAALEGGEWLAAPSGRNLPPGKTRYPFYRRLDGPQGRSGRAENLVATGIRSRTVQPVVSIPTELPGPQQRKIVVFWLKKNPPFYWAICGSCSTPTKHAEGLKNIRLILDMACNRYWTRPFERRWLNITMDLRLWNRRGSVFRRVNQCIATSLIILPLRPNLLLENSWIINIVSLLKTGSCLNFEVALPSAKLFKKKTRLTLMAFKKQTAQINYWNCDVKTKTSKLPLKINMGIS